MGTYAPESLALTQLPDSGLQPVKVAQGRMQLEAQAEQLKGVAEKAKKAEEAKVRAAATKPDMSKVYYRHQQEGARKYNDYLKGLAQIEKNWADNRTNPDFNPDEPGTTANLQREALGQGMVQFAKSSADIQAQGDDLMKQFGARTDIDPQWAADLLEWQGSLNGLYNGEGPPMPELYWDKAKAYEDYFGKIKADKRATATAGGGYIDENTVEAITEPDIRNVAQSMATDQLAAANIQKEINALGAAEKAALMEQSRQSGMTPVSQKFYNDNLYRTQRVETKNKSADNTFNNKWGSGWGDKEIVADRFVKVLDGISKNDSEVMDMLFGKQRSFIGDGKTEFIGATTDELKGMPLPPVRSEDGKNEIKVTVGDIETMPGGKIKVNVVRNDGEPSDPIIMPQQDFASNMTEILVESSKELTRGQVYKKMQERGMIKESGYIKPTGKPNPYNQPAAKPKKF